MLHKKLLIPIILILFISGIKVTQAGSPIATVFWEIFKEVTVATASDIFRDFLFRDNLTEKEVAYLRTRVDQLKRELLRHKETGSYSSVKEFNSVKQTIFGLDKIVNTLENRINSLESAVKSLKQEIDLIKQYVGVTKLTDTIKKGDIKSTFYGFIEAWNNKQHGQLISYLTPEFYDFTDGKATFYHDYVAGKKRLFKKYRWISVEVSDVKYAFNGNEGTVTYYQHFNSPSYESWGTNRFYFRKQGGQTKIFKEEFLHRDRSKRK